MIIRALYDDKPCYLNADYIVDIFPQSGLYVAYTLDNEREGYILTEDDFNRLLNYKNDDVQNVRIVKDHTNCPYADECTSACRGSVIVEDMGRYDHYTDSFIKE